MHMHEAERQVAAPLLGLQRMLAEINDVPVEYCVTDFLINDAAHCGALLGRELTREEDEQVLISETEAGADLGVYIDKQVTARLTRNNPLQCLSDDNLHDFCAAVEGISHFQYLIWCLQHSRQVSLLELELQAEVDKYAAATCLLLQQSRRFHAGLHRRLFAHATLLPTLDAASRHRYWEANRCAARFCRRNDERFLSCRQPRIECWLAELRTLFRCSNHQKLRRALN
ncbi:MAG: hypothetical protein QM808_00045 [Steroidobacteraceae bacterium]